jgi:mannitol-specific phosphotransferase system IIBC component
VKVLLYTLLRTVVFIGVALAVWFLFGWNRWGWLGAVLSIVVGGVVAFAVGYLFFDKTRRQAAESVEDRVNRRKAAQQPKATRADEEAAIEDAVQDQQRLSAGLSADDRRPTEVTDIDDER